MSKYKVCYSWGTQNIMEAKTLFALTTAIQLNIDQQGFKLHRSTQR